MVLFHLLLIEVIFNKINHYVRDTIKATLTDFKLNYEVNEKKPLCKARNIGYREGNILVLTTNG